MLVLGGQTVISSFMYLPLYVMLYNVHSENIQGQNTHFLVLQHELLVLSSTHW